MQKNDNLNIHFTIASQQILNAMTYNGQKPLFLV